MEWIDELEDQSVDVQVNAVTTLTQKLREDELKDIDDFMEGIVEEEEEDEEFQEEIKTQLEEIEKEEIAVKQQSSQLELIDTASKQVLDEQPII